MTRSESIHPPRRGLPGMPRLALCALLAAALPASAQSAGQFVIPGLRSTAQFAYWDLFATPSGQTFNYGYANPPALLDGTGQDDTGNLTTLFSPQAVLLQTGSPTAFITSSGAIYDFGATTGFEMRYTRPSSVTGAVTNVIFQTQTGGRRFDVDNIRLKFTRGAEIVSLAPAFRALDDPQSGTFNERLVAAFQWDLTGQQAGDFTLHYSAPGSSMPLWQAQLDVVAGAPFVQVLGYLLLTESRPVLRYSIAGKVAKNVPPGIDERFHLSGQQVEVSAEPEPGWLHSGWRSDTGALSDSLTYPVAFTNADRGVTALFVPETWSAWRSGMFAHANSLLGQPADHLNDAISAMTADPDGDGADNFSEYAFGGDPLVHDPAARAVSVGTVTEGAAQYAAVTFPAVASADGSGDLDYIVSVSSELQSWQENGETEVTVEHSRRLREDGRTLITVRSTQPFSAARSLYFRIRAE